MFIDARKVRERDFPREEGITVGLGEEERRSVRRAR